MPRILGAEPRLVDLGVVCLICLRAEPSYCSIYGQDLETPHMQIVDKIRSCSVLQLDTPLGQLPDKICFGCRNELTITYRFQQKCLEAQKVLQSTATMLLDVDKMQLEQQQLLKLPSSLKIKRLGTETPKYYDDDEHTLTLMQQEDVTAALVLQDVMAESSDDDNKMLALDFDWSAEQTGEQQEQQQQEEQQSESELELDGENERLKQEVEELVPDPCDDDYNLVEKQHVDALLKPCVASNNTNTNIGIIHGVAQRIRRPERKICDICGNTYKYQHALNAHMRRHNNERPYPCEVCNKAFISNVELRRHMRVHTGQKPYGCHYCERRFSDFGSSKKHERIHTGERPYICETCNKGFAYAHVLSVHRRTHTGKKQFQCTECDKGFTKKSYLATHIEQHRITTSKPNVKQPASAQLPRLPTRNDLERKEQQQQRLRQQQLLRYDSRAGNIDVDDDDFEDENVSVGTGIGMSRLSQMGGEQAKVLEECIVNNDILFNDEDEDELEHDLDDYHDTELDDGDFQSIQHVKVPYELVGDLLDADNLVNDTKYLMD